MTALNLSTFRRTRLKRAFTARAAASLPYVFLALACVLLAAPSAFAAATFSGATPAPSSTIGTPRPLIQVTADDTRDVWLGSGNWMKVDGKTVKMTMTFPKLPGGGTDNTKPTLSYTPTSNLSEGKHTVQVQIFTGLRSTYTWSFTVASGPELSAPSPTPDTTVDRTDPPITAYLESPTADVTLSATLDGDAVPATYDAGTHLVTVHPAAPLTNDERHEVTLIATTPSGSATLNWGFSVQIYPAMPVISTCWTCHAGYPDAHPMDDCVACHGPGYGPGDGHSSVVLQGSTCTSCHGGDGVYTSIAPTHYFTADAYHLSESCSPCHLKSLSVEHARFGLTCGTCHYSTDATVVAAIAANSTACTAVDSDPTHGVVHASDVSGDCLGCHSQDAVTVHMTGTASSSAGQCKSCHPTPRDSVGIWDGTCSQGDCHVDGSSAAQHGAITSAHALPVPTPGCMGDECHSGTDLSVIHVNASAETPGGTRESCMVCHDVDAVPSTKDCATCHPDRLAAHGYDAARHTSTDACLGACHDSELKPAHNALATPVSCSGCHPVKVDEVTPWDKTCAACHPVIEHATATHTGTDATVRKYRYRAAGCSDTPARSQIGCHNLSDLAALHAAMEPSGCLVCHDDGKTAQSDCESCHAISNSPTARSATVYPAGDDSLTAAATVLPAAPATLWDKVDEATSDNDTTYIRLGSAGRATFTAPSPAVPSRSTVITGVSISYRLRYLSGDAGTLPCDAGATIKVGGAYYDEPTPNAATTSYVLKTYTFANNPATGQPWTLDEVNALEGFGVYSTDAAPGVRVTQVYATVNYTVDPFDTIDATAAWYHHNNRKYLLDQSDLTTASPYYYPDNEPPHGWSAKYHQDCSLACHANYYGTSWSAYQGTKMWYSLAGQAQNYPGTSIPIPETRTLTLSAGTLPDAAQLTFKTRYQLNGTTPVTCYVELSTNDGASWTQLTGTVFGSPVSSITGNSPASWGDAVYDLSAYAGQDAKIRFRYEMPGYNAGAGWAMDNITITGSSGVFFSDDAEMENPAWSATQWYREQYAIPYF